MWDFVEKSVKRVGAFIGVGQVLQQILELPHEQGLALMREKILEMDDKQFADLKRLIKTKIWAAQNHVQENDRSGGNTFEELVHNFKMSQRQDFKEAHCEREREVQRLEYFLDYAEKVHVAKLEHLNRQQHPSNTPPSPQASTHTTSPEGGHESQSPSTPGVPPVKTQSELSSTGALKEDNVGQVDPSELFLKAKILLANNPQTEDYNLAFLYLSDAMNSGHAQATYLYGHLILSGRLGNKVSRETGIRSIQKAVELGDAEASYWSMIEACSDEEKRSVSDDQASLPSSYPLELEYSALSIVNDCLNEQALANLATAMVLQGELDLGIRMNISATESGSLTAAQSLVRCFQGGLKGLPIKSTTSTDLDLSLLNGDEDKNKVEHCKDVLKLAEASDLDSAKLRLGFISLLGRYGYKKDYARAAELLLPLAKKQNGDACFGLGLMYKKGLGLTQSDELAESCFNLALKFGTQFQTLAQKSRGVGRKTAATTAAV